MSRRRGSLGHAAPEEIGAEEGDGPAVSVLWVHQPLYAQVIDELEPEPGQGEEIEGGGQRTVIGDR